MLSPVDNNRLYKDDEDEDELDEEEEVVLSASGKDGSNPTPSPTQQSPFKKYTGRFVDPLNEKLYDADNLVKYIKSQRIATIIMVFVFVIHLALDFTRAPWNNERIAMYTIFDGVNLGWSLLIAILLWPEVLRPYVQQILFVFAYGLSFTLLYSQHTIPINDETKDYQVNLVSVVLLFACTCTRLKSWLLNLCCVLIILTDLVLVFVFYHDRYSFIIVMGFIFGLITTAILGTYPGHFVEKITRRGFLQMQKLEVQNKNLMWAQKQDDSLLQNIFPLGLSNKLKNMSALEGKGRAGEGALLFVDEYPSVTVLLVDIVGFTALSSKLSPQEIVSILNTVFSMFDDIVEQADMEKIRTIGDAYFCVANMTIKVGSHQERALLVGLQMLACLPKLQNLVKTDPPISLRVGIATGPAISGITGTIKWNYDCFGNVVLQAFDMEAMCSPGCIAVTGDVLKALPKEKYTHTLLSEYNGAKAYTIAANGNNRESTYGNLVPNAIGDDDYVPSTLTTPRSVKSNTLTHIGHVIGMLDDSSDTMTLNHSIVDVSDTASSVAGDERDRETFTYSSNGKKVLVKSGSAHSAHTLNSSSDEKIHIKDLTQDNKEFLETQAGLEKELTSLHTKKIKWAFLSKKLESDYLSDKAKKTHAYTKNLTICVLVVLVLYWVTDIHTVYHPTIDTIPLGLWLVHVVGILLTAAYLGFVMTTHYLKPYGAIVSAVWLVTVSAMISAQQYIDNRTMYHFYRPLIFVFVCYVYIRLKALYAWLAAICATVMGLGIMMVSLAGNADVTTLIVLYLGSNIVSFIANVALEQGMRKEFLMVRVLRNGMKEKRRTNKRAKLLLHNILPVEIAKRLGSQNSNIVDYFPSATMAFLHLDVGSLASHPSRMFHALNDLFCKFDTIALKNGVEKIKTINTTYMMASGIPKEKNNHAQIAIRTILSMFEALRNYTCPYIDPNTGKPYTIRLRAGVASGAVVAGVIGKTKYAYDCWSDCTNTASRMESTATDGSIQITEKVYEVVKEAYPAFTARGTIEIKGKGTMSTYLLKVH